MTRIAPPVRPRPVPTPARRRRPGSPFRAPLDVLEGRQLLSTVPTIATLASSDATLAAGRPLTLTATVAAAPGYPTPTGGVVTFKDGSTVLGTAPLAAGTATFQVGTLAVGTHSLTAAYGGTSQFAGGVSGLTPTSTIATVAGTSQGYSGDGGSATGAQLNYPYSLVVDSAGNLLIVDHNNNAIREVTADGLIKTVAGNGFAGYSGDGGSATGASLHGPGGIALDAAGNIFFSDQGNNAIREISGGIITTVAGTGGAGHDGDGGAAIDAQLHSPEGIAFDPEGNLYIAEYGNNDVRKIAAQGGKITGQSTITTVAGTVSEGQAQAGYGGDGGPATSAFLRTPTNVTVDAAGNLFIADFNNSAIREVAAGDGTIRTIAGNGTDGYGGDGRDATLAQINHPEAMAFDAAGNLFFADLYNNVLREVTTDGIIHTVVGNTLASDTGDGGPASQATVAGPYAVTFDARGDLYISEFSRGLVRVIRADLPVTIVPNVATHFVVSGATGGVAGVAESFTVTAYDDYGNVATGYTGLVHFTSSDAKGLLPADATLTAGVGQFSTTLKTAGTQTLAATDATLAGLHDALTLLVSAGPVAQLDVSGSATSLAGVSTTFTVAAYDAFGNAATAATSTVKLVSSDAAATFPATLTLAGGVATLPVTFNTVGLRSITATDSEDGRITGAATGYTFPVIRGTVYRDLDASGTRNAGEPGMPGRVVYLDLNRDGVVDAAEPTATTDAAGNFKFTGYAAGTEPVLEATDRDASDRHVADLISTGADGSVLVGVVPYSPVAPVAVTFGLPASAGTDPADPRFVASLYRSVLGRVGGAEEVQGWMALIGSGMTRGQVTAGFVNSPEHRQDQVAGYYRDFLHRGTDPSSSFWVDELLAGVSEQRVARSILDSPEYQAAHADPSSLIRDLYLDVLGRQGEPEGVARWGQLVGAGMTRTELVARFVGSPEAVDQIIDSNYAAFLHRQPDPSSIDWRTMIRSGVGTPAEVAAEILASPEYLDLNAKVQA